MPVERFKIDVPAWTLTDLRERLARVRWPKAVNAPAWEQGTDLAYLKELVDFWRVQYDWRTHEGELNRFSHFKAKPLGVGVHFIHERGKGPSPTPIVLTHGWPDSFYRFHKVIPMLTDPEKFGGDPAHSFDVIAPSMPGFGFSDPTPMADSEVAKLWNELMVEELGYDRFVAAGGDLGTGVTICLAARFPDRVSGIHLTDVGYPLPEDVVGLPESVQRLAKYVQRWFFTEGGYVFAQSTKPQTLAYGLTDSPVGLAAWIVEKFRAWSDCKGDVEARFTKDELLTNIMIYWVTGTIGSSVRMYYENRRSDLGALVKARDRNGINKVPADVVHFPGDIAPLPREWAEHVVKLRRFKEMPRGGHFAPMEEPELYADEVRQLAEQEHRGS
jgi:pimeloyl-ACP methyl ester carboxylesterase